MIAGVFDVDTLSLFEAAEDEALALGHRFIGTEHVLLALVRHGEGPASDALTSLGVTADGVVTEVVRIVGPGDVLTPGQLLPTAGMLSVAMRARRSDGGTATREDLLGALISGRRSRAVRVLLALDVSPDDVRDALHATTVA